MAAYAFFTATTTNLFIQNIKTMAEANGWIIDFFGLYGSNNRLHLHNSAGAHFEIWYSSATAVNIRGCTGYDSGAIPTAQPGVSGNCTFGANGAHLIVIGPSAIYIKQVTSSKAQNIQFGSIIEKIGSWIGGTFISSTCGDLASYAFSLWSSYSAFPSQVYINGAWSTLSSINAGGVYGVCESELYAKMPFSYSGGIVPVPMLLVRINPTTTSYRDPLGYAPDLRRFSGGDVYAQLEEILINGETWLCVNQGETGGTFASNPDVLIKLAA